MQQTRGQKTVRHSSGLMSSFYHEIRRTPLLGFEVFEQDSWSLANMILATDYTDCTDFLLDFFSFSVQICDNYPNPNPNPIPEVS